MTPDDFQHLPDADLYAREYELRQILDRMKTMAELREATLLKAEIRRRFLKTLQDRETERADS